MQEILGIRPAVLSFDTYTTRNRLRGFRHFFCHAYELPLNYELLMVNFNLAKEVLPQLERDIQDFLEATQK